MYVTCIVHTHFIGVHLTRPLFLPSELKMASNFRSKVLFANQLVFYKYVYTSLVKNPPSPQDIIRVAEKISVELRSDIQWRMFGMTLLDTEDDHQLSMIEQSSKEMNLNEKCNELLSLWKKTSANPKWEQVIQTLRSLNLNNLAAKLEIAIVVDKTIVVEKTLEKQGLKEGKHRCF